MQRSCRWDDRETFYQRKEVVHCSYRRALPKSRWASRLRNYGQVENIKFLARRSPKFQGNNKYPGLRILTKEDGDDRRNKYSGLDKTQRDIYLGIVQISR
jgi:hypothetical protein